jgi:hypothetical protein
MNATITVEDYPGGVRVKLSVVDAELKHLVKAFDEAVSDFRRISREGKWTVQIEVEDAAREARNVPSR